MNAKTRKCGVCCSRLVEKQQDGTYTETDEKVRAAANDALKAMAFEQWKIEMIGTLFAGLSLGSILLLAALGLAITYGLIGVINMAHGEFLMIGAYATYVVQELFRSHWVGAIDWYPLAAVPASFLAAAITGFILERGVLRFLYGRPLETLLSTFGISLVLIQAVRMLFGAQNVEVSNPSWMSGGVALMPNLILPFNRIVIMIFALTVVGIASLVLNKTRLGLYIRATTQNRRMAACSGIRTWQVDSYAFAFGAGIADWADARSRRSEMSVRIWDRTILSTHSWWWCWAASASSQGRSLGLWDLASSAK